MVTELPRFPTAAPGDLPPPPEVDVQVYARAHVEVAARGTVAYQEVPSAGVSNIAVGFLTETELPQHVRAACMKSAFPEFAHGMLGTGPLATKGFDIFAGVSPQSEAPTFWITAVRGYEDAALTHLRASIRRAREQGPTGLVAVPSEAAGNRMVLAEGWARWLLSHESLPQGSEVDGCVRLLEELDGHTPAVTISMAGPTTPRAIEGPLGEFLGPDGTLRRGIQRWEVRPPSKGRDVVVVDVPGSTRPVVALALRGMSGPLAHGAQGAVVSLAKFSDRSPNRVLRDKLQATYGVIPTHRGHDVSFVMEVDPELTGVAIDELVAAVPLLVEDRSPERLRKLLEEDLHAALGGLSGFSVFTQSRYAETWPYIESRAVHVATDEELTDVFRAVTDVSSASIVILCDRTQRVGDGSILEQIEQVASDLPTPRTVRVVAAGR